MKKRIIGISGPRNLPLKAQAFAPPCEGLDHLEREHCLAKIAWLDSKGIVIYY